MKKLAALILLLAFPALAQIAYVNTTQLTTNTAVHYFIQTLPGQYTNELVTALETNVIKGETLPVGFGKVNANFLWLSSAIRTNGAAANGYIPYKTNNATGYYWAAPPSGGGGSATNAVLIYNGGATNLTVTNQFTLISGPFLKYASVTLSNECTYYDSGLGYLTNCAGKVLWAEPYDGANGYFGDSTSGLTNTGWMTNTVVVTNTVGTNTVVVTNTVGTLTNSITTNNVFPLNYLSSQVNYINVTNGPGSGWYYPIDALHYIFAQSSYTGVSTNTYTASLIFSSCSLAGANQGYTSNSTTLWTGITDSSYSFNYVGAPNFRWFVYHGADHNVQSKAGSAGTPPITASWDGGSASGGVTTLGLATNYTTNVLVYFTCYVTNAWRFYSSTNPVTFSSPAQTYTGTGIGERFYVTNITISPVTNYSSTNVAATYAANSNQLVTFYGWNATQTGYPITNYIPGGTGYSNVTYWTNVTITVTTGGGSGGGSGGRACARYITATVGGVCKNLKDGWKMVETAGLYNAQTGYTSSYLNISTNGTATWVLFNKTVSTYLWNDPQWETNMPSAACVSCQQASATLPASYGMFSTGGGSIGGITVVIPPSN